MPVNHGSHENPTLRGGLCNTATGVLTSGASLLQNTEFKN